MRSAARHRALIRAEIDCAVAIFRAELRSVRRSATCWVVAGVAAGVAGLVYGHFAVAHGGFPRTDVPYGDLGPRYLLPQIGPPLLLALLFATALLASGAPSRDRRERLADALDSRPASSLSLAAGRALAVAAAAWLQAVAVLGAVQLVGHVAVAFDWWAGAPLEARSLAAFLLLDAPAALLLVSSLTMLLAVVLSGRLAAAAVAIGALLVLYWALSQTPAYLLPVASPVASYGMTVSELAPVFADGATLAQRGALLAFAAAALLFAAACRRPRDAAHVRGRVAAGVALTVAGAAVLATLAWQAREDKRQRADWLAAHRAAAAEDPGTARLRHVEGEVRVDPGRALHLDVALRLELPENGAEALTFTLNPGLAVASVAVDGAHASFDHMDGLLTVRPDAPVAARQTVVAIRASGVPDADFAYLDSALDWRGLPPSQLHFLGTDALVFEPGYAALMPGAFWLPRPGAAVPARPGEAVRFDLHGVDLGVEVPASWLVAGPGCIEPEDGPAAAPGGVRRFRVRPSAPVAAVGLFASRFERRTGIAGPVRVDVLLASRHAGNLDLFADAAEALRGHLGDVLADAAAHGLAYPYGCMTAVEAPASLRGYGGGWRMASALTLPGVLAIRERGFPTADYRRAFASPWSALYSDADHKAGILHDTVYREITGAAPLEWLVHNLLLNQAAVVGRGADAVRYFLHELLARLLDPGLPPNRQLASARLYDLDARPHMFAAHAFRARMPGLQPARRGHRYGTAVLWIHNERVHVVATVPPVAYADAPSPEFAGALMRGSAVARDLIDVMGRERTWALLAELRRRHKGAGFGWPDVERAGADLGVDIGALFGPWLEDPRLPGYRASRATVARVRDDDQGRQRYAIRLHVRNGEPMSGIVRLAFPGESPGEPIPVPALSAVEISFANPESPNGLLLVPGLSLNRKAFHVDLAEVAGSDDAAPFFGVRPSAWRPAEPDGIVVDDLDPGFSIEATGAEGRRPLAAASAALWRQVSVWGSWGEYRHTAALTAGEGRTRAVFAAAVETPGRYDLDYHVPDRRIPPRPEGWPVAFADRAMGDHEIAVEAAGVEAVLRFDGSAAGAGWIKLGSFDLPAGPVRVAVSDRTEGETLVIADAIRWRPVPPRATSPTEPAGP